ncbi:MAG TPA: hypothetical protein VJS37_03325 [Terriglobales bacterium]|nr:hypothetical protein [Terriglobales bacterium]
MAEKIVADWPEWKNQPVFVKKAEEPVERERLRKRIVELARQEDAIDREIEAPSGPIGGAGRGAVMGVEERERKIDNLASDLHDSMCDRAGCEYDKTEHVQQITQKLTGLMDWQREQDARIAESAKVSKCKLDECMMCYTAEMIAEAIRDDSESRGRR